MVHTYSQFLAAFDVAGFRDHHCQWPHYQMPWQRLGTHSLEGGIHKPRGQDF